MEGAMKATDIIIRDHNIIRKALGRLDKALLMRTPTWTIVARNVANYLEIGLREYLISEERWLFDPLAKTGPDAAGVSAELEREHRELETRLAEFKALTRHAITEEIAPLVQEKGVALVKEFLHHMFLEEELGFLLAEQRLGPAYLEQVAEQIYLLKEAGKELEEPAAID
jgi:iron-sulfur cluster repair protein YtfE (RIC family)